MKHVSEARRERLIKLLDIDLSWNLIRTSDGQRRRVQIALGLMREYKVLLMDEITVDLDVLSRLDLLQFFKDECEERGATIIYATHIFDGMEKWATHMAFVTEGKLKRGGPTAAIKELNTGKRLLDVMTMWLREEQVRRRRLRHHGGPAPPSLCIQGSRTRNTPSPRCRTPPRTAMDNVEQRSQRGRISPPAPPQPADTRVPCPGRWSVRRWGTRRRARVARLTPSASRRSCHPSTLRSSADNGTISDSVAKTLWTHAPAGRKAVRAPGYGGASAAACAVSGKRTAALSRDR